MSERLVSEQVIFRNQNRQYLRKWCFQLNWSENVDIFLYCFSRCKSFACRHKWIYVRRSLGGTIKSTNVCSKMVIAHEMYALEMRTGFFRKRGKDGMKQEHRYISPIRTCNVVDKRLIFDGKVYTLYHKPKSANKIN